MINEFAFPSQSVGGDECDQGIPDCDKKKEDRQTYYRGLRNNGTDPDARMDDDVSVLADGTLDPTRGISLNTNPAAIPSYRNPAPLLFYDRTKFRIVLTSGTHYELMPYRGLTYNGYLEAQRKNIYGPMIRR